MKKYVIEAVAFPRRGTHYFASQAPVDVAAIAKRIGYRPLYRRISQRNGMSSVLDLWLLLRLWLLPRGTVVLYQHPVYFSSWIHRQFLRVVQRRRLWLITLIHDLEMFRYPGADHEEREKGLFSCSQVVIAHNTQMMAYLQDKGVPGDKLIDLQIFDYLLAPAPEDVQRETPVDGRSLIVAGNLSENKCGYLYQLLEDGAIPLDLYGVNFAHADDVDRYPTVRYHGAFPAPMLPHCIAGGFGLVWDGSSTTACSGSFGEYLKINNPHKTSLYLASGLPVVIWRQAALAAFVEENGVGIAVDTLEEVGRRIREIPEEAYAEMAQRAAALGVQLQQGAYTTAALQAAERLRTGEGP